MAKIIVVGGGIVGLCSALSLLSQGHDVTIIDRNPRGESTCWASCGLIASSDIIPLSKPGTLLKSPKWLLDPLGALSLRPDAVLPMVPWLVRFMGNARLSKIKSISRDMAVLARPALRDTQDFLQQYNLSYLLTDNPVLELYDTMAELYHERPYHAIRRELGFTVDEISGDEVAELEPALAKDFAAAAILQDWRSVVDTKRYMLALYDTFVQNGGTVQASQVTGLSTQGTTVNGVRTQTGETIIGDTVVICAGAWSKPLAKSMGVNIQLEGVVGYQTIVPPCPTLCSDEPPIPLQHGLIYHKGGFCITPYERGIAIGGSIEFATLNAQPKWQRANGMLQKAKRVLPHLQTLNYPSKGAAPNDTKSTSTQSPLIQSMGRRPLTPDTKPIIGRSPMANNVILATGHGQLGLTLAATTAKIVSGLVTAPANPIDISAYAVDRF